MVKQLSIMNNEQIKHLEFIQGIINRMNSNSFAIKGWAITIISALLALYASSSNVVYIFIAIIPTVIFWSLDSYYLQQERKFRGLYSDVINPNKNIASFVMSVDSYKEGMYKFRKSFWSRTTATLYLSISLLLLFGGLILTFLDSIIKLISNGKEASIL